MIVYSVTLNVDEDVHEEWLSWMNEVHIPEVMETGHFENHRILRLINHSSDEPGETYNIQYDCPSMAELHKYQSRHAPKLQKDVNDRYEGKFAAFRTLLETV